MYTRSYLNEEQEISVPEKYGGNAFSEAEKEQNDGACEAMKPSDAREDTSPEHRDEGEEAEHAGIFTSLFDMLPFKSLFSSQGGLGSIFKPSGFKIGAEEMLIAALAAYLFLSKDGDRECGILLFLLLFIS